MKLKYKISLGIIFILLILSIYISFDYAKYKNNNQDIFSGAMVLSEGDLSINFSSGNILYANDLKQDYIMEKKFSVTNMGTSTLYYTIAFNDIEYNIKSSENVLFSLTSTNKGAVINNEKIPEEASEITNLITIAPDTTQYYTLTIKCNKDLSSSESIKSTITIKSKDKSLQTFSDIILMNNEVKNYMTKPGKEISTTNEGLIAGNDDEGTTYYFRGNVTNNYVKFANNMWRIVRINGDHSVRLILNDIIDNTYAYNTNNLEEGITDYGTLTLFTSSSIKKELDSWYDTNIEPSAKYIVNSNFCMDTNISKEENNNKYYQSYVRVNEDENPLHNCVGTKITTNIGLLSVDEAIFAGSYKSIENKATYLYNPNINEDWWLINPYNITSENIVSMFVFKSENATVQTGSDILLTKGLRPVINIRDNVNITGTGTEEDPYVIE